MIILTGHLIAISGKKDLKIWKLVLKHRTVKGAFSQRLANYDKILTMLVKILNTPLLTIVTKSSQIRPRYVPGRSAIDCFIVDTTYHLLFQWIQQLLSVHFFWSLSYGIHHLICHMKTGNFLTFFVWSFISKKAIFWFMFYDLGCGHICFLTFA